LHTRPFFPHWLPPQASSFLDFLAATFSSIIHQCSAASTPLIPPSSPCYPIPSSQIATSPCSSCIIRSNLSS
jgi:hypothetical protein